ncbi:MAG: hypothetical protein PVF73_08205, partial [Bacteroidales bacterium]
MKTMAKGSTDILNRINSPFIINKSNVEIKLMDFHKVNRYYVLLLNVMNLSDDNYRIFLKGHYLSLIISEPKEVSKPVH